MDLPAAGVDDLDTDKQVLTGSHRTVKVQAQLTGGCMPILVEHRIGNTAHSLVRYHSCTASVEGMDHIAHRLCGMAKEPVYTRILIRFQQFHSQVTANRASGGRVDPSNTVAYTLRRGKIIDHALHIIAFMGTLCHKSMKMSIIDAPEWEILQNILLTLVLETGMIFVGNVQISRIYGTVRQSFLIDDRGASKKNWR